MLVVYIFLRCASHIGDLPCGGRAIVRQIRYASFMKIPSASWKWNSSLLSRKKNLRIYLRISFLVCTDRIKIARIDHKTSVISTCVNWAREESSEYSHSSCTLEKKRLMNRFGEFGRSRNKDIDRLVNQIWLREGGKNGSFYLHFVAEEYDRFFSSSSASNLS